MTLKSSLISSNSNFCDSILCFFLSVGYICPASRYIVWERWKKNQNLAQFLFLGFLFLSKQLQINRSPSSAIRIWTIFFFTVRQDWFEDTMPIQAPFLCSTLAFRSQSHQWLLRDMQNHGGKILWDFWGRIFLSLSQLICPYYHGSRVWSTIEC